MCDNSCQCRVQVVDEVGLVTYWCPREMTQEDGLCDGCRQNRDSGAGCGIAGERILGADEGSYNGEATALGIRG